MPSAFHVLFAFCLLQMSVCCTSPTGMASYRQQHLQTHRQQYTCPSACRCKCREKVSRMRCRKIPVVTSSQMTYTMMSIAQQNLTTIKQNAFKNIGTSVLDLHGNMLTSSIHDEAFVGLDMLKVLVLSDCGLTILPVAVTKLQSMEVLHLEYNNVSVIPTDFFIRNTQLLDLSLYRNRIHHIQTGAFSGLQKLQKLKLFGNAITRIRRRQLKGLKALKSLDLSHNLIRKLPGKLFKDLKHLTWLDLESNLLTFLNRNTFKGQRRLKYLNLARNPFSQIVDDTFTVVQRLRFLSIEVGYVERLSNSTFSGLRNLNTLHLGEAQHPTFPSGIFGSMGALRRLSVANNKGTFKGFLPKMFPVGYQFSQLSIWTVPMDGCSCRTKWIRKLTKKSAYVFGYCRNGHALGCKRKPKA